MSLTTRPWEHEATGLTAHKYAYIRVLSYGGTIKKNTFFPYLGCIYNHLHPILPAVDKLGPGDLLDVLTALFDVRADWEVIGLALKLTPGALRAMKGPYKDHRECMIGALTEWLNTSDASWSSLVQALRHPIVCQGNLAAELERKYLNQAGSGQRTGTSVTVNIVEWGDIVMNIL